LTVAAASKLLIKLGLATEPQILEATQDLPSGADGDNLLLALERKGYLTPFQSQKIAKGEMDGYFLGGFRLLYKISSGSFGRVYRGDDPHTGRIVAIKVLRRRWSDDQHRIDLFEREGK